MPERIIRRALTALFVPNCKTRIEEEAKPVGFLVVGEKG